METTINSQPTPDYSDMTNTRQLRSSIRRLFGGTVHEIMSELLQNSQRAGATEVGICTSDDGGWTFTDNGHGLKAGLDGFWTLLRLAESYFNNPTIADQAPMGLGVHALLAHEQVSEVTFSSGQLSLTVDTERWWADEAYYTSWKDRVVATLDPVVGLHISVRSTPALVKTVRELALPRHHHSTGIRWSPFQGYADYLSVAMDGEPVVTDVPQWAIPTRCVIRTRYMGQELIIGGSWRENDTSDVEYIGAATVCWFGQMIDVPGLRGWSYHLKVRDGRPINPKSPSRQGVIEDSAFHALQEFVRDTIFSVLAKSENRHKVSPVVLKAAFNLDHQRAKAELPYVLVAPYTGLSEDELNFNGLQGRGKAVVLAYDAVPFLLRDGLYVDSKVETHKAEWERRLKQTIASQELAAEPAPAQAAEAEVDPFRAVEYGLDAFIPLLKAQGITPYELVLGDEHRLQTYDLYWKPAAARPDEFNEPGVWGLSATDAEPETWHAVTGVDTVFAFSDTSSYDPDEVDWVVGTTNARGFVRHEAWFAFWASDEEDYERQEEQYGDVLSVWLRKLIGDCIPADFQHSHIQKMMPTPTARITSVQFHYARKKRGVNPDKDLRSPIAITARNAAGERKRLLLVP